MNPLICSKCLGQMIKVMDGDLYQCEECGRMVSAVYEEGNSPEQTR